MKQRIIAFCTFLADRYFRAQLVFRGHGTRTLHQGKPVIFVSNHSGMNFPWDNIILYMLVTRFFGPSFKFMPLATPSLYTRLLQPFAMSKFFQFLSSVASSENFDRVANAGYNILLNPEGIAGIAKGFDKKYRLQKYASSFVRIALQHDREIAPIYVINGEYLNPFAYSLGWLNKLGQRVGIPYLPIGLLTPLYMLFPFVMYIALPARMRYVFGEKIDVKKFTSKPVDQMSTEELRDVAEKVRVIMQRELDGFVEEFGATKFGLREFLAEFRGGDVLKLIPLSWPFVFHAMDDESKRGMTLSSWIVCTAMVTPLIGWPVFWAYLAYKSTRKEPAQLNVHAARPLNLEKVA